MPGAGILKNRARERTWVQVGYSVGDARSWEAGTGRNDTKIGESQTRVIVKVT